MVGALMKGVGRLVKGQTPPKHPALIQGKSKNVTPQKAVFISLQVWRLCIKFLSLSPLSLLSFPSALPTPLRFAS